MKIQNEFSSPRLVKHRTMIMNKKGAGARPTITAIILIALFGWCLVAFAFAFVHQNNPNSSLLTDQKTSQFYTAINGSLSKLENNNTGVYNALSSDTPSPIYIFLVLPTIAKIPFIILGSMINIAKVMLLFIFTTLFGPEFAIILGVLTTIIIIAAIFFAIKIIRIGETER